MKRYLLLLCLSIICSAIIVLTSCAPSPSRGIVIDPNIDVNDDSNEIIEDEYEEKEPGIIHITEQIQGNFINIYLDADVILPKETNIPLIKVQRLFAEPETILDMFFGEKKYKAITNVIEDKSENEVYKILESTLDDEEISYSQKLGIIYYKKNTTDEAMDRTKIINEGIDAPGCSTDGAEAEKYAADMIEEVSKWLGVEFELYDKIVYDSTEFMTKGFYDFLYAPIMKDICVEPRSYEFSGSRIGTVSGGGVRVSVTSEIAEVMINIYKPIEELEYKSIMAPQDAVSHLKKQIHLLAAADELNIHKVELLYLPLMSKDEKYRFILTPYWTFTNSMRESGTNIVIRINAVTGELLI